MLMRYLPHIAIRVSNIFQRAGPASALVADAAVFEIRRCDSLRCERSAQVPSMIQGVFVAPEAAVNADRNRMRTFRLGQTKVKELRCVRSISHARIGGRGCQVENVFSGHGQLLD